MAQSLGENAHLSREGWSRWLRAMVPAEGPEKKIRRHYKRRSGDQTGVTCTNIKKALQGETKNCGIYEWKAKGTSEGQPDKVVYVGSTCSAKPGSLRTRVLQYCTNGSHKSKPINHALKRG